MHNRRRPDEPYLRYYSLGGLGEVGMNCAVFESDDRMIIVDCGVTFPESLHYGIDLIIPDFTPLVEQADRIEALIITHGHMDHIGAVPYLLRVLNVPVYAPAMAIELLRGMLHEHHLLDDAKLHVVDQDTTLELGPFTIEFPQVNHSIPHAHGLAIRTDAGLFVHTGDFKIDDHAIDEAPFDRARFERYGNQGVRALFSDSTNVEVAGWSRSERDVRDALLQTIQEQTGRVFVGLFSSNVTRLHSLLLAAEATGRSVVLLGRSVQSTLHAAERAGALTIPSGVHITDIESIREHEDHELLFLCTGTQAEPRAALTRLATENYRGLRFKEGDTVMFSSRTIPGNEQWVYQLYDRLARQNVNVITPDDAPIHATGHGYQEELAEMIRLVRPQTMVPVHGDHRFQQKHARLSASLGVKRQHVLDNGQVLQFTAYDSRVVATFDAGRLLLDGTIFDAIEGEAFRQRRQIARAGLVWVSLLIDRDTLSPLDAAEILNLGAYAEDREEGEEALEAVHSTIERTWRKLSHSTKHNEEEAAEALRIAVRKQLTRVLKRRPFVVARVQLV